jgi:hypothetical protein
MAREHGVADAVVDAIGRGEDPLFEADDERAVRRAAAAGWHADVGRIVTLPAEATGSAPGRGRLTGRRVLVVGAGTRPSPEPDPPIGIDTRR